MPIFAKAGASFTPAPAGAHAAVCVDVVDLGMLEVAYQGKTKSQHKISIVWQIDEERDDGKPFTVRKRYTLSLHEKSGLRKDLESWRGRQFNEQELQGFDVENLLSAPCMLNVIHQQRGSDVFANVSSIMRLPKGMTAPSPREYVRVCDREPSQGMAAPGEQEGPVVTEDDIPF